MPLPDLGGIKSRRKKVHLTQTELANMVDVDRQVLGKIERGDYKSVDYDDAKRLLDELEVIEKATSVYVVGKTGAEVATKDIMYAESRETPLEVWIRMNETDISQFPVREGDLIVGSVTERSVNRAILQGAKRNIPLTDPSIRALVVEPSFPEVDASTSLSLITLLLQDSLAVLLKDKGKVVGIVTNVDIGQVILPPGGTKRKPRLGNDEKMGHYGPDKE